MSITQTPMSRANRLALLALCAVGLQPCLADDAGFEGGWPVQRVFPGDSVSGDLFGFQTAVSGPVALVTAPNLSAGASPPPGALYAFARDTDGLWKQAQKLTVGEAADAFGFSLSMTTKTSALVGAPFAAARGSAEAGVVRVCLSDRAGTWSLGQKLESPAAPNATFFGIALASSGSRALILGERANTWELYAFERSAGGTWQYKQTIATPEGYVWDGTALTTSIAMSGNTALLLFPGATVGKVEDQGEVFVYTYSGGQWALAEKLLGENAGSMAFGLQAAVVDDDNVLVSAPGQLPTGVVYEFRRIAGHWTQMEEFSVPSTNLFDVFSFGLAATHGPLGLQGMPSFVGSDPVDFDPAINIGAAHVFTYNGSTWVPIAKLKWSFTSQTVIGTGAAIDDETVMVAGTPQVFYGSGPGVVDFYSRP